MKNLIQDTIKKIEKQHIIPEPKWKYSLRKYGLWSLFAVVLILAAISFSAALDNAKNLDWDLYRFMRQNRFVYFLSILPYFWAVFVAIFLIAAFFEIRRTETGYRYSWLKIFMIIVGGILTLGILMSLFGLGGKLHSALSNNFPFYGRHMLVTKESQWMQPAEGFLAGTIISVSDDKLKVDDLDGKDWNILIDEKTAIRSAVNIVQEETIKIIGTQQDADNFKAEEIRPWGGRGMISGGASQNRKMKNNGAGKGMMRGD